MPKAWLEGSVCCDYTDLSKWANEWQTLIAGVLAVVGALAGGAWAFSGARNAAHRQIQALQKQNNELRRAEQRRLARESSTVAGMLYAAMGLVAGDIGRALAAIPKVISASFRGRLPPDDPPLDPQIANYIRRMVGKHGLDYLRDRVGIFNREDIAVAFMLLEAGIDLLRVEQRAIQASQLREQLENLFKTVTHLRTLATKELESARTILSEDEPPTELRPPMNWRVGLLRLWIVATAIWFVIVVRTGWPAYPHVGFSLDTFLDWARETLPNLAGWLLIPPIAVLAVGASLAWAFRGFRVR